MGVAVLVGEGLAVVALAVASGTLFEQFFDDNLLIRNDFF